METKIAIGLVIYNCEPNLLKRISQALQLGYSVYVYDNSPEKDFFRNFSKGKSNLRYFTCGKNVGLGIAMSTVCAQAYYDNFYGLLFFDQDTVFSSETIDFISKFYSSRYKALKEIYSSIVFNAKSVAKVTVEDLEIKDVLFSINSGSLYFLENLRRVGWFNETFFVDCVDYEFCLRSSNRNFKVGECSTTPGFDHVSEQADEVYTIWNMKLRLRKYPFKRLTGTIKASLRIFLMATKSGNIKYSIAIIRSLSIYLFFQFVVRVMLLFKKG
ncbi:MAG: glycosyltransferase [Bacteroidota bacterium]|nr:glycosyltransferase [Bacteroidota bacterium]